MIVLTGGMACALFSPLANLASNDQLHFLQPGVQPLSSFTMNFWCRPAVAELGTTRTWRSTTCS